MCLLSDATAGAWASFPREHVCAPASGASLGSLTRAWTDGVRTSHAERDEFEAYDRIHGIRSKFVQELQREFPDFGLKYSIGP